MLKKVLPVLMLAWLTAGPVQSQENDTDKKFFFTRQECDPAEKIMDFLSTYGEEPLFTGLAMTFSLQGQPFTGSSMFFVNQETGSWSLVTMYADETACMTAIGSEFSPYIQGQVAER